MSQGTGKVQLRGVARDGAEQPLPGETEGHQAITAQFLGLVYHHRGLKCWGEQKLSSELQGGWSWSYSPGVPPKGVAVECSCGEHGLFLQQTLCRAVQTRLAVVVLARLTPASLPPHSRCRCGRGQGELEAAEHLPVALRDGAQAGGRRGRAQT